MSGQMLNLWELVLPLIVVCRLRTVYSVGPSCIKAVMVMLQAWGVFLCSVKPVEFSSAASVCCCSAIV